MSEHQHARTLIDDIADYTLKVGREISWFCDPLTPGRGRLYLLQHILRNRMALIGERAMTRKQAPKVPEETGPTIVPAGMRT